MDNVILVVLTLNSIFVSSFSQVHDVVLCRSSNQQQTIKCETSHVIDIQSVTIAYLDLANPAACSPNLVSDIMQVYPDCTGSYRNDKVYSRCQGKQSCSVDGSIVDPTYLRWDCDFGRYSNVLWFTYSCLKVIDVVLCKISNQQQTIQCEMNEIIDIQSVTLANMFNHAECSVDLISTIAILGSSCKRSDKNYGEDVYSRCYGEPICTLNGSMVDEKFIGWYCNNPRGPSATVMWFNYNCHPIDPATPSVALLPIPENREVRGLEVEIFSPYYPCYLPRPDREYSLDCKITPNRLYPGSLITYRVKPKYVEILQNAADNKECIRFDHGSARGEVYRHYCGWDGGDKEWRNTPLIISDNRNEFHIKYFTTPDAGDGTKFWFIVTAEEYGEAIEVNVTCSGQENIPSLPPDSTCSPFPQTTTTTSTTTTIPTTPTSIPENTSGSEKQMQPSNDDSQGVLFGVLGGVLALVIIIACVAIILFFVIRKHRRRSDDEEKEMPPTTATPPRKPRPKSIQKIANLMRPKRLAPNNPYEEQAQAGRSPGSTTGEGPEKPTKPPKPEKKPRPSSIAKMAALIKKNSPKRKAPNPKEANGAVVGPLEVYATVDKNRKNGKSAESDKTQNNVYAVPDKNKNKKRQNYENTADGNEDETVMWENDDLYSSATAVENNNNDDEHDEHDEQDEEQREVTEYSDVRPVSTVYEDVKATSTDPEDQGSHPDETVTLPDDFPNQARSRTSIV